MSTLDPLDHAIIDMLARDARVSYRHIATALGVTEGTIRTRVRRLQDDRLIRFTLVTDFRMAGSPNLAMLGISAESAHVRRLAADLSEIPEISCVIMMLGRYSVLAMGLFMTAEQVHAVVQSRIVPLPGVLNVTISIALHTLKYDVRKARIAPAALTEQQPTDAIVT